MAGQVSVALLVVLPEDCSTTVPLTCDTVCPGGLGGTGWTITIEGAHGDCSPECGACSDTPAPCENFNGVWGTTFLSGGGICCSGNAWFGSTQCINSSADCSGILILCFDEDNQIWTLQPLVGGNLSGLYTGYWTCSISNFNCTGSSLFTWVPGPNPQDCCNFQDWVVVVTRV